MPLIDTARGPIWYADHRKPESPYPPVIMVHGAAGTHLDWPGELRRMPEANAIALDLPGHCKSPGDSRASVEDYALDVVALMDALAIARAVIFGHSMGGAIALTMALEHTPRVCRLIVMGSGAQLKIRRHLLNIIVDETRRAARLISRWLWTDGTKEHLRRQSFLRLVGNSPHGLYDDFTACHAYDIRGRLGAICVPVLVIGGTADHLTPYPWSVYLAENLPDARLVTIDGVGHMMALEQPEVVARAVQTWLRKDGGCHVAGTLQ